MAHPGERREIDDGYHYFSEVLKFRLSLQEALNSPAPTGGDTDARPHPALPSPAPKTLGHETASLSGKATLMSTLVPFAAAAGTTSELPTDLMSTIAIMVAIMLLGFAVSWARNVMVAVWQMTRMLLSSLGVVVLVFFSLVALIGALVVSALGR